MLILVQGEYCCVVLCCVVMNVSFGCKCVFLADTSCAFYSFYSIFYPTEQEQQPFAWSRCTPTSNTPPA